MTSFGADAPRRIVLDTSAYSRFRSGDPRMLDCLTRAEAVLLPVIVLGELEAGFRLGRHVRENRVALAEFLQEPFVAVSSVTPDVARRYGEIFAELRRAGTPISVNDLWIAACTLESGAHLVTYDADFERISKLEKTVLV
jgi:tRNA(fMet)-specific endonuclease VapC